MAENINNYYPTFMMFTIYDTIQIKRLFKVLGNLHTRAKRNKT